MKFLINFFPVCFLLNPKEKSIPSLSPACVPQCHGRGCRLRHAGGQEGAEGLLRGAGPGGADPRLPGTLGATSRRCPACVGASPRGCECPAARPGTSAAGCLPSALPLGVSSPWGLPMGVKNSQEKKKTPTKNPWLEAGEHGEAVAKWSPVLRQLVLPPLICK